MRIQYREISKMDESKMKQLYNQAWQVSEDCQDNPALAEEVLETSVLHYLSQQNYGRAAIVDGQLAGFLLGRNFHQSIWQQRLTHTPSLLWHTGPLFGSAEGRKWISVGRKTNQVNRRLLKQRQQDFDGEITLLIVDPAYRGHGIASQLIQDFFAHMQARRGYTIRLFTDTYSNYHFYLRQGWRQEAALPVDFSKKSKRPKTARKLPIYYLFSYQIPEAAHHV